MRDVVRQLRTDRNIVPDLVDEYTVHTPRPEAIKASRQVCGVSHYLSLMATGEVDMRKCALYGVTITCIDEVTDELGEELHPDAIEQAFDGDSEYKPLRILPVAADAAENAGFEYAVSEIARWQDASMEQFGDIDRRTVEQITNNKGGWSATANLYMFKEEISESERGAIFAFGKLMQLLDDYLDQPKDARNNLTTLYMFDRWDYDLLGRTIESVADMCGREWGPSKAHERFFRVCRLHRQLGRIENETPLKAAWLAPGYL